MPLFPFERARPSAKVLFEEVGGEGVLLHLDTDEFYSLNPVGTRVWQLIAAEEQVEKVFVCLLDEFEGEPQRVAEDLRCLLSELGELGFLETE